MPANPNLEAATGSKVRIFVAQISMLGPLLLPPHISPRSPRFKMSCYIALNHIV